ncbi:integrator complex subunit 9-like [Planoprotostelium fungivorum]|uniref:Integrator complex subunit 9-like n=1 Tax=Planoprotostelium fungivorum TaxID=1890364 RepID=A0A2P6NH17_9EUKA|nr:integrator complex subunit 9-like [Planoprotostelium fungivorum]PRP83256.1 integrator complex subunit 9-like [Planoprotostelium fungivorum]
MKLYCLGLDPFGSCFLLKYGNTRILLDCALETQSFLRFLPQLAERRGDSHSDDSCIKNLNGKTLIDSKPRYQPPLFDMIDPEEIDAILISNVESALALPYLTEYTNFKGKIFATEPTTQLAKQLMEELIYYDGQNTVVDRPEWRNLDSDALNQLPEYFRSSSRWLPMYSRFQVENCIGKITPLSYHQSEVHTQIIFIAHQCPQKIYDTIITPVSSGYSIGACNWVLNVHKQKIAYVNSSSMASRHPESFHLNELCGAQLLIVNSLMAEPNYNPDAMYQDLCSHLKTTLNGQGSVLIPSGSSGIVLDLIELVYKFLVANNMNSIPIYFLTPSGEYILAYSSIVSEWLCKAKQEKVYTPEPPFLFEEMRRLDRLCCMRDATISADVQPNGNGGLGSLKHIKEPCVVFSGHPSLRFGAVTQLLNAWGPNSKNSIVFIDSEYDHQLALLPFRTDKFRMKIEYYPIDTRFGVSEISGYLVQQIRPKHLVMPLHYFNPSGPVIRNLTLPQDISTTFISHRDVIHIPFKPPYHRATLSQELARSIDTSHTIRDLIISDIDATLDSRDARLQLDTPSHPTKKPKILWTSQMVTPQQLLAAISEKMKVRGEELDVVEEKTNERRERHHDRHGRPEDEGEPD